MTSIAEEQVLHAPRRSTAVRAGDVAKMRGAGFRIMGLLESDAARRQAAEEQGASRVLPRVRSASREAKWDPVYGPLDRHHTEVCEDPSDIASNSHTRGCVESDDKNA